MVSKKLHNVCKLYFSLSFSDPPLIRSKKNIPNPGILGKVMDSVSKKVKYSSEIITGIKNDQSMTWSTWLSNSLSSGTSSS